MIEIDPTSMRGDYSTDKLREALVARLAAVSEFRQKIADSQHNLDHPVWIDAPTFQVDRHLFHDRVPEPGGLDTELQCVPVSPRNR